MSAKEIKALVGIGTTMGYSGEELKRSVKDERFRIDRKKLKMKGRKQIMRDSVKKRKLKMKDDVNLSLKSLNWNQKQNRKRLTLWQNKRKLKQRK